MRGPNGRTPPPAPSREVGLAPMRPTSTLVVTDIDGTLLPAAESAAAWDAHRADLRDLCGELLAHPAATLVFVTGRRALNARDVVGVSAWIAGVHGAELLAPYARRPVPYPARSAHAHLVRRFAGVISGLGLCPEGMHLEDKGVILAVHHPRIRSRRAARRLAALTSIATAYGLTTVTGRGWTEYRAPALPDKGDVVPELVRRWRPRRLVVAGDDRSDLAAFEAAVRLTNDKAIEGHTRIAVRSPGAPADCQRSADLVMDGPAAYRDWLRRHVLGAAPFGSS